MPRATEQAPWIVFYSWQSDLPNATNRGFIEKALENACKAIQASLPHTIGPIIDRDTKGVPGSPEIARTIFGKIDQAQVVVCDVSIINSTCLKHDGPARATPNPNVLIELGYALKALEDKCVILIMNVAYGGIELLPFDLKTRRTIAYNVPADAPDRQQERKRLEGIFADALRTVGKDLSGRTASVTASPPLLEQAVTAIDEAQPKRISLVRQYMKQFTAEIAAIMPPPQDIQRSRSDDVLSDAIDATIAAVGQYSRLVAAVAANGDMEAARVIYSDFTQLLDLYWLPRGYSAGPFCEEAFDLAKFVGHEAFVSLFALPIRENKWDLIADMLDEDLYVNARLGARPGSVDIGYVSQYLRLLDERKNRLQLRYFTLHGFLLSERHGRGELGDIVPLLQFAEADYFLYLCGQIRPEDRPKGNLWRPWSAVYLNELPRFLDGAVRVKGAERLLRSFGVDDIPTLRRRWSERVMPLADVFGWPHFDDPIRDFEPQTIGSKL